MKFLFIFLFSFFAISANTYTPMEGDIIFQQTNSSQARALRIATGSSYTHVGIVFKFENEWKVIHANGPVQKTNLKKFISSGINGKYKVLRLKDESVLDAEKISELKKMSESFLGKPYDFKFEFSDEKQYCSEFVWKVYERTLGIKLSKPKLLEEYNTKNLFVKFMVWKRGISKTEKMIAPSDLEQSSYLKQVSD
ncbi:MAG: YiiX/YebB-like N1pC/P60 family cysteine hydrolase [Leptospiraceae bacterium]|nr:YiiX/YebB-like N1pC/P60 family cysteine hydrolase [Leptospiraceae bacterium]